MAWRTSGVTPSKARSYVVVTPWSRTRASSSDKVKKAHLVRPHAASYPSDRPIGTSAPLCIVLSDAVDTKAFRRPDDGLLDLRRPRASCIQFGVLRQIQTHPRRPPQVQRLRRWTAHANTAASIADRGRVSAAGRILSGPSALGLGHSMGTNRHGVNAVVVRSPMLRMGLAWGGWRGCGS